VMHFNPLNGAFLRRFQPFAVPASDGSVCPSSAIWNPMARRFAVDQATLVTGRPQA
jgi:hypothetical protein